MKRRRFILKLHILFGNSLAISCRSLRRLNPQTSEPRWIQDFELVTTFGASLFSHALQSSLVLSDFRPDKGAISNPSSESGLWESFRSVLSIQLAGLSAAWFQSVTHAVLVLIFIFPNLTQISPNIDKGNGLSRPQAWRAYSQRSVCTETQCEDAVRRSSPKKQYDLKQSFRLLISRQRFCSKSPAITIESFERERDSEQREDAALPN